MYRCACTWIHHTDHKSLITLDHNKSVRKMCAQSGIDKASAVTSKNAVVTSNYQVKLWLVIFAIRTFQLILEIQYLPNHCFSIQELGVYSKSNALTTSPYHQITLFIPRIVCKYIFLPINKHVCYLFKNLKRFDKFEPLLREKCI